MLVLKFFWVKKLMGQKIFGAKKILGEKIFGLKRFIGWKLLGQLSFSLQGDQTCPALLPTYLKLK